MDLDIVIHSEAGTQSTRLQAPGPFVVGRDATAQLRLESGLVSRKHVVLQASASGLRVQDQSRNGTLAGEQLVHQTFADVPFNTPIVVGEFTLYIRPVGGVPAATPDAQAGAPPALAAAPRGAVPPPGPPPGAGRPPPTTPGVGRPPASNGTPGLPPPPTLARPPARPPGPPPPKKAATSTNGAAAKAPPPTSPANPLPPAQASEQQTREGEATADLRREIHQQLLEHLDLATMNASKLDDPSMRPKVLGALRRIIELMGPRIPASVQRDRLIGELADEALGLGPLESLLADPAVSEIMVIDADTIYIERNGKIILSDQHFTDDTRVRAVIERIVTPLGRRIDESSPLVDARLKDGSRVNAVIKPIAIKGSCITIRKFAKNPLTMDKLMGFGAFTEQMGRFLTRCVVAKKNVVISGGTGSGKTTLLNVLSGSIPKEERIVTIEDAAELQLQQPHVVSLETKTANMEGKGEYTIRDLLKNAMRMRPDRIVVGECRGGEALDMLQAMNTGHDGSLTTTHSNSPREACKRLETLCLMAGVDLPSRAIREQIAASVQVIVQQTRYADGSRRVDEISEVIGLDDDGAIEMRPIFKFVRTGTDKDGKVIGQHQATGYLPTFLNTFIVMGLVKKGAAYL